MRNLAYVFSILLVMFFTGCNKDHIASSSEERVLNLSFQSEVRSLDPRIGVDYPSSFAVKMLFEGLTRIGFDKNIEPAIAQSWEISEDQTQYTFHLRPSSWSNGDPVSAEDFVYTWKKVLDPHLATTAVHHFYPIKNVQAIVQGKKAIDEMGIKALDSQTLVIELEHPTPYFLEALAAPAFFPVNPRVDRENNDWTERAATFVSNGPFRLKEWKIENELELIKNPQYWDAPSVRLPGIKIAIIKDPMTQFGMYEKEELEWAGKPLAKLALDSIKTLKKKGVISFYPSLGINWCILNTEKYPFNNKKMRLAFAYAVNRKEITDNVLQEGEIPALSVLGRSTAVQEEPYFKDNNVSKARELFDEALSELGFDRSNLPDITLNYTATELHQRLAVTLQEQWHKAFGIRIHLQAHEWKVHFNQLVNGDFQFGMTSWYPAFRDAIYTLEIFKYRSEGANISQWENEDYQALLDASDHEVDLAKRKEYFHRAEELLMEEMPVIPLFFTVISYVQAPYLKNVRLTECNDVDFRWAYFEESK